MAVAQEISYHGWMIEIIQETSGYRFQCWMTDHLMGVTDYHYYNTFQQAISAGQLRADLESVRLSLTSFLQSKLHRLLLKAPERKALENSIATYIDQAR